MKEVILIKLGEIVLKGLNRRRFEEVLLQNIRRRIKPLGGFDIREAQSTVYITPREGADIDTAIEKVSRIFGIAAFSRACEVPKDLSAIENGAAEYLKRELCGVSTFKVECKRSDKQFPMKSPEICAEVGGFLLTGSRT